MAFFSLILVGFFLTSPLFAGVVKHYDIKIHSCEINVSGKKVVDFALCVNGGIPAPTLEFREGDTAEIRVVNELDEETSVHWHGILLPNVMDGVSYVTSLPIKPRSEHIFRFPLRQAGTFWYHSHTGLQEQKGVFGPLIIHSAPDKINDKTVDVDKEYVAILSDWTDENPNQVLANLKKDGDFYRFKKNRIPSLIDAWENDSLKEYLDSQKTRMGAMDLSDVGYDAFLINGRRSDKVDLQPGKKMRLRVINAAASSFFYVQVGSGSFVVLAADGVEVKPMEVKELLMGMGETYDLLIAADSAKSLEFRATAHDISGFATLQIGSGPVDSPISKRLPSLYKMEHSEHEHHSQAHSSPKEFTPKVMSQYPASAPRRDFQFILQGDMERYTWALQNSQLDHHKSIYVNQGEVLRFELKNETMMHHPMHLHGHYFKVLPEEDLDTRNAALKHTVNVPPHSTKIIEFYTDEPGYWLFHCHNLYHMKAGMDAQVRYLDFSPSAEIQAVLHKDPHQHEHVYYYGRSDLFSDEAALYLRASTSRWQMDLDYEYAFEEKLSTAQLRLHRWFDNYTHVFTGILFNEPVKVEPIVGLFYLLPYQVDSEITFNATHSLGLSLSKELVVTKDLEVDLGLGWNRQNFKLISEVGLFYRYNWNFKAGIRYKGDDGSLSLGVIAQF